MQHRHHKKQKRVNKEAWLNEDARVNKGTQVNKEALRVILELVVGDSITKYTPVPYQAIARKLASIFGPKGMVNGNSMTRCTNRYPGEHVQIWSAVQNATR